MLGNLLLIVFFLYNINAFWTLMSFLTKILLLLTGNLSVNRKAISARASKRVLKFLRFYHASRLVCARDEWLKFKQPQGYFPRDSFLIKQALSYGSAQKPLLWLMNSYSVVLRVPAI